MQFKQNPYVVNSHDYLQRQGYGLKYEKAGIYCIKVDEFIVYIGKSHDMLWRVAQHYVEIKMQSSLKYRLMAEAQRKGRAINFDVLYCAQEKNYPAITEEIGQKEGEYIRAYRPLLNTQIPHEDNWREFDVVPIDVETARKVLQLGDNARQPANSQQAEL